MAEVQEVTTALVVQVSHAAADPFISATGEHQAQLSHSGAVPIQFYRDAPEELIGMLDAQHEELLLQRLLIYLVPTREPTRSLPDLYLHRLASGDFELAVCRLVGERAALSPSTEARVKERLTGGIQQVASAEDRGRGCVPVFDGLSRSGPRALACAEMLPVIGRLARTHLGGDDRTACIPLEVLGSTRRRAGFRIASWPTDDWTLRDCRACPLPVCSACWQP